MPNEYGLDTDYFIRLCAREFNPDVIRRQNPEDLARALARAARTACAEVLREREFLPAAPEGFALVPIERSYDMRVAAILHFNTARQAGQDLDDALDAAWQATLAKAHHPADPLGLAPLAEQFNKAPAAALRPTPDADQIALDAAIDIMALMYGPTPAGGSVQLKAQVQCRVLDAIKAAPRPAMPGSAEGR